MIAVDVGYGQLHYRLRSDDRVTVLERTNARHLTPQDLPRVPDLLTCDASFIGLATVLQAPISCMAPGFWGLVLCKPQFEAGPERMRRAGKGGVLKDPAIRQQVLDETIERISALGVAVIGVEQAWPPGPKGNIEYVLLVVDDRDAAESEASANRHT